MIPGIVASGFVEVATGPAFRSISTSNSDTTSLTVTMPAGVSSGDILVMQVAQFRDPKSGSYVTTPAGWTARQNSSDNGSSEFRVFVFTKTAGASESSVVFSPINNNFMITATVLAVSGATSVDVAGVMEYSGTYVAPSVTTTTSNTLLIGMWARSYFDSVALRFTVPGSMAERSNNGFAGSIGYRWFTAFATETLTASGATGTRTATFPNASGGKYATLLAVK